MKVNKIKKQVSKFVEGLYSRGADGQAIALALIEHGATMQRDEEGIDEFVGSFKGGDGFCMIHGVAQQPLAGLTPIRHLTEALGGLVSGNRYLVSVDAQCSGFTVEKNPDLRPPVVIFDRGGEEGPAPFPPLTLSRISELLDYASCYGDYDENTPNGTPSDSDGGHGMNDYRRAAIVLLKKVLGLLPPVGEGDPIIFPDHGYRVVELEAVIRDAGHMFNGYAGHHLAKSPPDLDKARRNADMAQKLFDAIGQAYVPPEVPAESPQEAARHAVQADLLPGTGQRPYKLSTAALDRQELLDWIDMKLDGCAKNGMREASDVLQAFRGEIAQHLEAAPIDFGEALTLFYKEVYARNVAAGWWSDLSNDEPKKRSVGELFVLFVTELWEAYDAWRQNAADDKLPQYAGIGVELGDLQIRLADFCGALLAGNIVEDSGTRNPGDEMFREIGVIAARYEAIRKSPEARGDIEQGAFLPAMDVGEMVIAKMAFNAIRPDHKVENRKAEGGKQT